MNRVVAYLLDNSVLEEPPGYLTLAWVHLEGAISAVTVDVSISEDLSHWSELLEYATLEDLP